MQLSGRGVALSFFASCIFTIIPAYVLLLTPLDGVQVFAQRVIWSLPAVFILLMLAGRGPALKHCVQRLVREPRLVVAMVLAAALMGVQWLMFVWAPLTGHMLDLTLGYFLMPLVLVLAGRLFYNEYLRNLQRIAVLFALVGMLHELWRIGGLSWVTVVCALGYPPYFMLRRWMGFDAFSGFFLEMLVMLPVAVYLIVSFAPINVFTDTPQLWYLLPGLGLISTFAFAAMLGASRLLPLGLLGILSYVEPVLLFLFSVLWIGEAVESEQWWTYVPIWIAVILVIFDSLRVLLKQSRRLN
ncbi:EamA family transporter RarD [Denitrificimonas caeni]|uniref:EamA family transporter RarD n=1 Tax=Denitrificimonas caeni TaxID=521720 RepID=UPI001966B67F|nr:EamA family transporter RarD [Denitrificimonas caeni]